MEIIVGKTAGFCYGVKRAVDGANEEIKKQKKTYCLGEIVHNKEVVKKLEEKGIKFIEKLEEAEKNTNVIIRAHGVPKEIYEEANEKKINLIDFTCTKVLNIHKIVEEYNERGYFIVLCGSKNHPENIGTISYCPDNNFILENEKQIEFLLNYIEENKIRKILLIAQTTYSTEKFIIIEKELKENIGENIELITKNTICMATQLRQEETKEISQKVEYMIIIGGKNSSNTKKLFDISQKYCKQSICIENSKELDENELKQYKNIGIMAGASTPKESIEEVLKKIGE